MQLALLLAIGGTAVVALRAVAVRGQSRDDRTRKAFARPIRQIRDVKNGSIVVVVGTLSHRLSVEAHMTRRPCAAFEFVDACKVEEVWHEQARYVSSTDFSIRDATGEALVYGFGAEVLLNKEHRWRRGDDAWEMREGFVTNGDQVAVYGHANWEPDPRPESAGLGYRARPTILVIRGTRRAPLCLTNSPAILARAR